MTRLSTADREAIERIVWSLVARMDRRNMNVHPERAIDTAVRSFEAGSYPDGISAFAAECSVPWPADPELLDASAAAGRARWATILRDDAIRKATTAHSLRAVATVAGISHEEVRRIANRTPAESPEE